MIRRRTLFKVALTMVAVLATGSLLVVARASNGTSFAASTKSVELCHGYQLVGAVVRTGIWTGNLDTLVFITNASDSTCRLEGYPTLVGVRDNHRYPLQVTSHDVMATGLVPVTLKPRMSGAIIFGTGDACALLNQVDIGAIAAAHTYPSLVMTLPNNGGMITVLGVNLDTACYLSETQLGWSTPFPMILPS